MISTTQSFLPIDSIKDDVVILNDGTMAILLQTSAVNFDLLSETEQLAIIGSFAAMLNSLSFPIEIIIRSERLDISHYLHTLKEAEAKQNNALLKTMMQHYRQFVTNIIKNNEVLDKKFYVVITVSSLELGVVKNIEKNFEKGMTILMPRRDHIMRQLGRIGLKSSQLTTTKLLELFYDEYNDNFKSSFKGLEPEQLQELNKLAKQAPVAQPATPPAPTAVPTQPLQQPPVQQPAYAAPAPSPIQPQQVQPQQFQQQPQPQPIQQIPQQPPPQPQISFQQPPQVPRPVQPQVTPTFSLNRATPFVVEELPDDYGTV